MKVIVQRVKKASCEVDGQMISNIQNGFMLLVGFTHTDTLESVLQMVKKIVHLRIMDDENGVMNKSILETGGKILSISQFTLYADTKKGNRPSYANAMSGEEAIKLYNRFNEELNKIIEVKTGVFGANMQISLTNDGPVTIVLER